MNRTCDKRTQCCTPGESGEFGNPLANLSSEAPDLEVFFSLNWRHYIPGGGIPTGKFDCFSVCESEVSQQDADLCARQQSEDCTIINEPPILPCQTEPCPGTCDNPPCDIPPVYCQTPPCDVPPVNCLTPPCNPTPILYCNDAVTCGSGVCETTIPACSVTAGSKADANAIANSICAYYSFLCQRRNPPPPVPPVPPTPTLCASFTGYGQVSPVVLNEGDTTILSVTVGYEGEGPLIYVWYVNGFPLAVTPGPSLTLDNVTVIDSGTYALGISAPDCVPILSNSIVVQVNAVAFPYAWWTMEEASGDRIDSANGVALSPINNNVSQVAGQIGNGVEFSPADSGLNNFAYLGGGGDALQYSGDGFSVVGWFRFERYNFGSGAFLFQYSISTVPVSNLNIYVSGDVVEISADLEDATYQAFPISEPFIPTIGVWYFFAMTYDGIDGSFHLSINDGVVTDGSSSYILSPVNNGPGFLTGTAGYLAGTGSILRIDELAMFPYRLAANQITYLYNSGAGQTWPISLPPPV